MEEYEFKRGIRLVEGMGLIGESNKSYTLVIPEINPKKNKYLQSWYQDIAKNSNWSNEGEMALDIFKYLKERFGDNQGFERTGGRMSLNVALEHSKGVCKEKSAVFQIMSQILGLESVYMRGYKVSHDDEGKLIKERHAWNKVKIQGEIWFVDVTNKKFVKNYEEALEKYGDLTEGRNLIEMPHKLNKKEMAFIGGN